MADSEQAPKPELEEPALADHDLEDFEFVTLVGHQYVCVHLAENGWKRERGFLERRQRQEPVTVERRRAAGAG